MRLDKIITDSRIYPSRYQYDYIIQRDLGITLARFANCFDGKVLDYGCGRKPYEVLFSNVTDYFGADFPDNPLADVYLDFQGYLPKNLAGFDGVISIQVLEHVKDIGIYISECKRSIQDKSGELLLTTHGIWEYHPGPNDFTRWTHEGLVSIFETFGFKTFAIEPITTGRRSLLQISACRIRRRWGKQSRFASLLLFAINSFADIVSEDTDEKRRLYDFPICYVYYGGIG